MTWNVASGGLDAALPDRARVIGWTSETAESLSNVSKFVEYREYGGIGIETYEAVQTALYEAAHAMLTRSARWSSLKA